jgi:glycosyltransferase involved in cell wall biosynthesis
VVPRQPELQDFNIAAWTPVDHFPVPPEVRDFFRRTDAVPIAMSRFGEKLLRHAGLDPVYIPLSVDTKTYKPTPTVTINGKQITGREMLSDSASVPIDDDDFLVGMVAMNKGTNRDRKGFNEAFRAFGVFWKTHQNAKLYVHADWPGAAMGFNLKELATHCGIPPHAIVFPECTPTSRTGSPRADGGDVLELRRAARPEPR